MQYPNNVAAPLCGIAVSPLPQATSDFVTECLTSLFLYLRDGLLQLE